MPVDMAAVFEYAELICGKRLAQRQQFLGGQLEITSRSEKEHPDHHGATVALRLKSSHP
jgi:hypothetical protein